MQAKEIFYKIYYFAMFFIFFLLIQVNVFYIYNNKTSSIVQKIKAYTISWNKCKIYFVSVWYIYIQRTIHSSTHSRPMIRIRIHSCNFLLSKLYSNIHLKIPIAKFLPLLIWLYGYTKGLWCHDNKKSLWINDKKLLSMICQLNKKCMKKKKNEWKYSVQLSGQREMK